MDQLMQKLMVSKAIMDKTEGLSKSNYRPQSNQMLTPEFDIPQAKYNIPQEFLQESPQQGQVMQPYLSEAPRVNTKPVGNPTVDAIKNSRLPDEIKKLMMEHPIAQPQQQTATLSDDLIERASRLMKENGSNYLPDSAKPQTAQAPQSKPQTQPTTSSIDYKLIQKMIKEAVKDALLENGLIAESTEKSNEIFSFKVGKHVFEGKVTKIKKLS
jgi:hypothetical protein